MNKTLKRTMTATLLIIIFFVIASFLYMHQPKFGKSASGKRLERIRQSPNYKDGKFQNLSHTPNLTEGYSMLGLLYDMFAKKHPRRNPTDTLPTIKTNLKNLPLSENVLVWFGHSSYFMQINGKRFLVDPVFSGNASPIPSTNKSYQGTDSYSAIDFPKIDYLIISHDHYDHLDYETIISLKDKIDKIVCGLGVGEHFEHWGFKESQLIEKDWNESENLGNGFTISAVPGRHFSGRKFSRNVTLWTAYVLQTPTLKIFLGGDSGYDKHFAKIGEDFGPFDLAILENGQYNVAWQAIHTLPEETLKAARDLKTKRLLPVHSAKFTLAMHQWDEPLKELTRLNNKQIPLVTPIIGEIVKLDDSTQQFKEWWKGLN